MSHPAGSSVPPETQWRDLTPGTVALYTDDALLVVEATYVSTAEVRLKALRPDGVTLEQTVRRTQTVSQAFWTELGGKARAVTLPPAVWAPKHHPARLAALLGLVSVVAAVLIGYRYGEWAALGSLLVAPFLVWLFLQSSVAPSDVTFVAPDLTMDTVRSYALAAERGQVWIPPESGADPRELAARRVAAIRDRHAELRDDIAYRIRNSALFDPEVPATAAFEEALLGYLDLGADAPLPDVDEAAARVEVTFNLAQANAERLGFDHLPATARSDARRAEKAAHLAVGAATDGERAAALAQVQRILDSLALYYLPSRVAPRQVEPPDDKG